MRILPSVCFNQCYDVFYVCTSVASNPGAEEGEKSTWYPLFAHALDFPTFRESRIRPRHSRGLLTSDTCS